MFRIVSFMLVAAARAMLPAAISPIIDAVVKNESAKYNCSISVAVRGFNGTAAGAHGIVDFSSGVRAKTTDMYVWGSITKMLTASSIMKLISEGRFALDDPVAPLVDPFLAKMARADPTQNFSSMEDLWGTKVLKTTVRKLLSMRSNIPDFDTAKPDPTGYTDPLRAELYARPHHEYIPTTLMKEPWVAHKWNLCPFGFCYSSTNFMILGLILSAQTGAESWHNMDQKRFLPEYMRSSMVFANAGAPRNYTHVHGYDRTSYNMPKGVANDHDNWDVDGVFAVWTASNLVATPEIIADLVWEIYGPPSSIVPHEYVKEMTTFHGIIGFYGLGTMNVGRSLGHKDQYGVAYGHLGATYGYQSIAAFLPALNMSIAIASNIETDMQAQPSDTLCILYNKLLAQLLSKEYQCEFSAKGYYFGHCSCSEASVGQNNAVYI